MMNIVQIRGGLGNQMFQYAFYRALKQNKPETKLDSSIYRYRPSHTGYELERLFDIHPEHATIAERNQMADIGKDWWSEFRRAIGWKLHTTGQLTDEPDPSQGWRPDLLESENRYLRGYWQTEKYFAPIADSIRRDFRFRLPLPEAAQSMAEEMSRTNSVSVHIRRGNYLKKRRRADYEVCTETYYRRAVEYIRQHVADPVFYVFSDEPAWGQEQQLFPEGTVFVSGHTKDKAYIDMQLMSFCRHHIIANSSFSWWGAWLGQGPDTITLAPNIWFRYHPRPDVLPSKWIPINAE